MKKTLTIVTLLVLLFLLPMICAAQNNMSEGSLQNSSQESTQTSTQNSSDESGASSENSSQYSTEESTHATSDSPRWSTDATTEESTHNSNSTLVALMVAGAVVTIAITVGGIILTVSVSKAKKEEALKLQDQIYLADGKDYEDILAFFELDDRELIKANDELVAAGRQIASDQDAADYLAALILALTKKSEKVQYQLNIL
jgi:hypothetical protein